MDWHSFPDAFPPYFQYSQDRLQIPQDAGSHSGSGETRAHFSHYFSQHASFN